MLKQQHAEAAKAAVAAMVKAVVALALAIDFTGDIRKRGDAAAAGLGIRCCIACS